MGGAKGGSCVEMRYAVSSKRYPEGSLDCGPQASCDAGGKSDILCHLTKNI